MARDSERVRYPETFCTLESTVNLRYHPTISQRWDYTRSQLSLLNVNLTNALKDFPRSGTLCVATAGSFGRMEAAQGSDLDYIVLAAEPVAAEDAATLIATIRKAVEDTGIPLPSPEGVFGQVTQYEHLIERTGSKDDTLDTLAQRMLLLMEARPIYNETVFRNALDLILRKYLEYLNEDPDKEALFLLNDLIRYFRSICVNYQFNFWRHEEKWALRNMKLRHSRVIMYAGLLLTVLNASIHRNKPNYIRQMLFLTPLQRIVSVYQEASDMAYDRVLSAYDVFLNRIQDRAIRQKLQVEYEQRHSLPEYREMNITANALSAELTRFILAQRGRWTEAIFEYLLF